jgi:hypothetical protein
MEVAGSFRFVSLRARSDRFVKKCLRGQPCCPCTDARHRPLLQPAQVRELCARAKLSDAVVVVVVVVVVVHRYSTVIL